MVVLWPEAPASSGVETSLEGQSSIHKDHNRTFTSTRMDNTLTMPKKKRGRKPKVQLAGNSCFVWRDLTARRGPNRKKANQQQQQQKRQQQQQQQESLAAVASRVKDLKLVDPSSS